MRHWNLPLTYLPKIEAVLRGECTQTIRICTVSRAKNNRIKGRGTLSTYGDRELGEGKSFRNCKFAGKLHQAENDCNCCHPETGNVFFCATHHIKRQPKCPIDLLPGEIIHKQVGDQIRFYRWTVRIHYITRDQETCRYCEPGYDPERIKYLRESGRRMVNRINRKMYRKLHPGKEIVGGRWVEKKREVPA